MKNLLTVLLFIGFGGPLFGQKSLQYTLNEGDAFTIKQNALQVITQELDGATHEITNKIDGLMEFVVLGEIAENYQLTITFKDLNLNMSSSIQGELLNVNASVVDENDIQTKIFNSLLNTPIEMILAKNGDILEVNGGDSLVAKMASSSGLQDEFSLNMMKKSLEKEFGSRALSDSYKQMTFIYPNKSIKVGESWENEYSGKLSAKNIWTLESLSDTIATISGTAEVIMDITEPATTMKLNGTQQTTVTTNVSTGFIKMMTVKGSSTGISTMTQLGDQEIPTTIESTITYELVSPQSLEPIKE